MAHKNVTEDTFEQEALKSDTPVLVDFWAAKLNSDENPAVAAKYGVMSIPTMNVHKDGEVVQTLVGANPKAALERELADHLG
jgi:thioredoxin 1